MRFKLSIKLDSRNSVWTCRKGSKVNFINLQNLVFCTDFEKKSFDLDDFQITRVCSWTWNISSQYSRTIDYSGWSATQIAREFSFKFIKGLKHSLNEENHEFFEENELEKFETRIFESWVQVSLKIKVYKIRYFESLTFKVHTQKVWNLEKCWVWKADPNCFGNWLRIFSDLWLNVSLFQSFTQTFFYSLSLKASSSQVPETYYKFWIVEQYKIQNCKKNSRTRLKSFSNSKFQVWTCRNYKLLQS